jgi:hypothetical protein
VVANRNCAAIFSDDVSEGDSIGEGTEYRAVFVQPRG